VQASNTSTACKIRTKAAETTLLLRAEDFLATPGTNGPGSHLLAGTKGRVAGPPGGNIGSLIVGAAADFEGKLIFTVSFFRRLIESSSSSPGTSPIAVRVGGFGGGIEPADCVLGCLSSSFISLLQLGCGTLSIDMLCLNMTAGTSGRYSSTRKIQD
jgi:hypothetical protein